MARKPSPEQQFHLAEAEFASAQRTLERAPTWRRTVWQGSSHDQARPRGFLCPCSVRGVEPAPEAVDGRLSSARPELLLGSGPSGDR